MTVVLSRRALLAGGLGLAGAIIGSNAQRARRLRSDLVRSRLLAAPRNPLYVAMLDEHAARIAPLVPEIEAALGRRLSIESLGAEQLYANFTIDLLQQTGRYDAVSMNDAWIPYFGRRGYLTAVPEVEQAETGPTYPPVILESARGVDGTELVAYPWTFDYTCSAVSQALGLTYWSDNWTTTFPDLARAGARYGVAVQPPSSAAETYRAILMSYGGELVLPHTHEPGLDTYAATRALETTVRLAKLADVQTSLGRPLDQLAQIAVIGQVDFAPVLWASHSSSLWTAGSWDIELVPAGRIGHAATTGTFWMWGVPAGAPSVGKARQFVQLMTSPSIQGKLWNSAGLLPATRTAINGEWEPGGDEMKRITLAALDRCRFRPQLRSFRSLMDIAGQMVADTLNANDGAGLHVERANDLMREALIQEGELNA
jgi:ABC-type glycerol-3-phosphate transport system substrate-binding protein